MAGSSLLSNLARAAKVLALLLFLLPWVTVSCSTEALVAQAGPEAQAMPGPRSCVLIKASGMQLAMGNATPSRECVGGDATGADTGNESGDNNPFAKPDMMVIAAAVLILLSLAVSFLLKGGTGALAAGGGCLIAAGLLCYDVLVRIPQAVRDSMASGAGAGGGGGPSAEQLSQMIRTKAEIGFWLVIVALLAAIVLHILAMRKPSAAVPPATL
jgi:hypothetical protein